MATKSGDKLQSLIAAVIAVWMFAGPLVVDAAGQRRVSGASRTTTQRTTTTQRGAATQRGTATRSTATRSSTTVNRSATVTGGGYRRGAVVAGEEGYAAVGRRGAIVANEEGVAARGRYGNTVVANEEGVAARGRYGNVVVAERYESHDAWRIAAGTARAIAIGTMLARPPTAATTVVVANTTYWVYQNTYYARAYSNGAVVYQVVAPPR